MRRGIVRSLVVAAAVTLSWTIVVPAGAELAESSRPAYSATADRKPPPQTGPSAWDDSSQTSAPLFDSANDVVANSIPPNGYGTRGDNVHYSATPGEISGHGWWVNNSLPAGTRANVKIKLEVYVNSTFGWVDVTGWTTRYSTLPGTAYWANARLPGCNTSTGTWYLFRSVVDVDIIGYSDPDNVLHTPSKSLRC